jgi:hypothetical protein
MYESKYRRKRVKTSILLDIISKYNFLLIAIVAQIYVLLFISVASEFHQILGLAHDTLINVFAIISIVVLLIVYAMQWTYPMRNEIPLIIIMIWFLLSTQGNTYCICCNDQHNMHQEAVVGQMVIVKQEKEDDTMIVTTATHHHHHQDATNGGEEVFFVFALWQSLTKDCYKENFTFLYSLLGVFLLISSIFTSLRNYYVAFLNRVASIVLVLILILLLVIAPSSCSYFSTNNTFIAILHATLYHIVWFTNYYKTMTEQILVSDYAQAINLIKSDRNLLPRKKNRYQSEDNPHTPSEVIRDIERLSKLLHDETKYNLQKTTSSPKKKVKKKT